MCRVSHAHPQVCSLPFSLHRAAGGSCVSTSPAPLLFGFRLGLANRKSGQAVGSGMALENFFLYFPALASPVCPSAKLTASSRLTSLYNFLWIRVTMPPFPFRTGVAMACGHCPGLLLYPLWFPYPAHTFPKESPFLSALQIIQFESAIFFLLRPQRTKIICSKHLILTEGKT